MTMSYRRMISAIALAGLCATIADAQAWDDSKYPDLKGQWVRAEGARGVGRFDPTKPPAREQEAPLTAEYQGIYEANFADQAAGGQGVDPKWMPQLATNALPIAAIERPRSLFRARDQ